MCDADGSKQIVAEDGSTKPDQGKERADDRTDTHSHRGHPDGEGWKECTSPIDSQQGRNLGKSIAKDGEDDRSAHGHKECPGSLSTLLACDEGVVAGNSHGVGQLFLNDQFLAVERGEEGSQDCSYHSKYDQAGDGEGSTWVDHPQSRQGERQASGNHGTTAHDGMGDVDLLQA
ncbi:hypothetical protein SDC9_103391 [bioreactor metagenome]|uniref:Uncharacterized protein n=1 Tax=bioreactor metagenome TaxID=1076179 RepID=A0A645ATJ0_9ZZZZ